MNASDKRWSIARATEFFSGDGKADMLEIRAMTAVTKGANHKRDKFRRTVSKSSVVIYGPKHAQSSDVIASCGTREKIYIEDPRAPCLNIDHVNESYRLLPSSEKFSAHTGICQILGNKSIRGGKHRIRVGDIVRFGSVGLLVTEIDTGNQGTSDASLTSPEITNLIQRVICHDAISAADLDSGLDTDDDIGDLTLSDDIQSQTNMQRHSTNAICYVCYDESEENNPLIAPCRCTGDTKYIHLNCLKRWNTNGEKNEVCAILDESCARTCSICRSPYPSRTKIEDGKYVSLLPDRLSPPSIMFQVVTKHSSSTLNLSAKYHLSYKSLLENDIHRPLMVGRSSQCDLVLKYRTVSTIHAEIHYQKGEFYLKDAGSSNGTLRYIYRPLQLQSNQSIHIKFGRTILSVKPAKRMRLTHFFANHTPNILQPNSLRNEETGEVNEENTSPNSFSTSHNRLRTAFSSHPSRQSHVSSSHPTSPTVQSLQNQFHRLDLH